MALISPRLYHGRVPAPDPRRFSSLRLAASYAVAAALPVACVALAALVLGVLAAREDPWEEVETRAALGRAALADLEALETALKDRSDAWTAARRAQGSLEARAEVLERTLQRQGLLSDEAAALVAPAPGTGTIFEHEIPRIVLAGVTDGATLSATLPDVARALVTAGQGGRAFELERGEELWVVGPRGADRTRALVVRKLPAIEAPPDSRRAKSSLVALAAPVEHAPLRGWREGHLSDSLRTLLLCLVALVAGAVMFLVAHRRTAAPIARSLAAAEARAHGDPAARADPDRGGPAARDVARAVNALIDAEARALERKPAIDEARADRALAAIRALGRGDLATEREVRASDGPVLGAIAEARAALADRLLSVLRAASDVSIAVGDVSHAARKLSKTSAEAVEVLARVSGAATEATQEIQRSFGGLGAVLDELASLTAAHRRTAVQLRAELGVASRRAVELGALAEGLEVRSQETGALDEALDLLSAIAASGDTVAVRGLEGAGMPAGQVMMTVKRSREALEALRQEVGRFEGGIAEIARGLTSVSANPPVSAPELEARVVSALLATGTACVATAERLLEGLRALERIARGYEGASSEIAAGAQGARSHGPELALALSTFDLGSSFDRDLLERLSRARALLDDAGTETDRDSTEVALVLQAAEEARARLARLVANSEAAFDVLR